MIEIPYIYRVLAFFIFVGCMIGYSIWKNDRIRLHEYIAVILCGALGACYGMINDFITCRISPEYFIHGKGLEPGADLHLRAVLLGSHAGFVAGVIASMIVLFIVKPKTRIVRSMLKVIWQPVLLSLCLSIILSFLRYDAFGFTEILDNILSQMEIDRFLQVWWIHLGIYTGLLLGLVFMIITMVKSKKHIT